MEKRVLGKTGMQVSILGFGGAEIGYSNADEKHVEEMLGAAVDAGLNVIDTAECYGTSEENLGRVLSHRRKGIYLFSKCGHSQGYDDPDWDYPDRFMAGLERSLQRLKTDYLDLYQLHSCSKKVLERGHVIDFMKRVKESGKARFIGYSGDNESALYAVASGAFDTLQVSVNIADQSAIDGSVSQAVKQQMGVIAKRPIANVVWRKTIWPGEYYATYWERLQKLGFDFLRDHDSKDVGTALRFTLSVPGVSVAIVGTRRAGRWQENARMLADGLLEPSLYEAIRRRWKEVAGPAWKGEF